MNLVIMMDNNDLNTLKRKNSELYQQLPPINNLKDIHQERQIIHAALTDRFARIPDALALKY